MMIAILKYITLVAIFGLYFIVTFLIVGLIGIALLKIGGWLTRLANEEKDQKED